MKFFSKRSNLQELDDVGAEPVVNEPSHPPARPEGGRPKLGSAFADELKQSVHDLQEGKKSRRGRGVFRFLKKRKSSARRPEEEERAQHYVGARRDDFQDPPSSRRPTLSQAMAEELRMSFRNREEQKTGRRDQIRERLRIKRESMRGSSTMGSVDEVESESESGSEDTFGYEPAPSPHRRPVRPSLSRDLTDELKQSFVHRTAKKQGNRQEVIERLRKRRNSGSTFDSDSQDMSSSASFDEALNDSRQKGSRLDNRLGRNRNAGQKSSLRDTMHSTNTFDDASFSSDEEESVITWRRESSHRPVTKARRAASPIQEDSEGEPDSHKDSESNPESDRHLNRGEAQAQVDFETYKTEWTRLQHDKKKLEEQLLESTKSTAKLEQKVEELKAETVDLRKQLSNWQDKASKISKMQSADRIKADSSTDAIARARVKLTKALNENKLLKTRCNDLEVYIDDKESRVESLEQNLLYQSSKVEDLATQLKDTEAELRFNRDEKYRLNEELAVVTASRDGRDINETIRRLEKEKAAWLDERERALEAKRAALDEENDKQLERERRRHQKEADQHKIAAQKADRKQEDNKRVQQEINQQLKDMRDENKELQDRITKNEQEHEAEAKEKDEKIDSLKHKASRLQKRLAASEIHAKQNESRKAYAKSTVEDLKKQNKILEKKIESLQSAKEKTRIKSEDWKEIILPGHRNLRGVTFGADSDSLAGFLTILVEEQIKRRGSRKSSKSTKMEKFIKSREKLKSKAKSRDKSKYKGQTSSKSKSEQRKKGSKTKSSSGDKNKSTMKESKKKKSASKKDVKKKSASQKRQSSSRQKTENKKKARSSTKKPRNSKMKSKKSKHTSKKDNKGDSGERSKSRTRKSASEKAKDRKRKVDSDRANVNASQSRKRQPSRSRSGRNDRHSRGKNRRIVEDTGMRYRRQASQSEGQRRSSASNRQGAHDKRSSKHGSERKPSKQISYKKRQRSANNLETSENSSMVALKIEHRSKRNQSHERGNRIPSVMPPTTIILQ